MANAAGTFNLDVGNVPGSARGGAVVLSAGGSQEFSFTDALRDGMTSFQLSLSNSTDPAAGPATGPADAVGAASPGTALAAAFFQPAALALTIGLIGTPSAEFDGSATAGPGGEPGSSASSAAGAAGQSLSQSSGSSGSTASDDGAGAETQTTPLFFKNLLSAIDEAIRDEGEKLGNRLPVVKSTLRLLERVTVLGEALGWHRPPIVRLLCRKLIDVVEQPGVPAAVGAGNPPRAPRLGGQPTSPVPARWDEALEWLSMAEKPTEIGVPRHSDKGIQAVLGRHFLVHCCLSGQGSYLDQIEREDPPCLTRLPRRHCRLTRRNGKPHEPMRPR